MFRPPSCVCCKIPFSTKSFISLKAVSVEVLVILAHFDVCVFQNIQIIYRKFAVIIIFFHRTGEFTIDIAKACTFPCAFLKDSPSMSFFPFYDLDKD